MFHFGIHFLSEDANWKFDKGCRDMTPRRICTSDFLVMGDGIIVVFFKSREDLVLFSMSNRVGGRRAAVTVVVSSHATVTDG